MNAVNESIATKCTAVTKRGTLFRAKPTANGLCPMHSQPGLAAELGRRGGAKNRHYFPVGAEKKLDPPATAADVQKILAEAMEDICGRRMGPKIGTTLGYLRAALLKAMELHQLERRIEALEQGERPRICRRE